MIQALELTNFRSHANLSVEIKDEKVAIVGNNAVGKTNILEAIHFSFLSKPFYSNQFKLIKNNENFLKLKTTFLDKKKFELECVIRNDQGVKKDIKLNKVTKKTNEIVGILPIVLFLPDSVRIITDSPEYRRKFLNTTLVQTDSGYLKVLSNFQKILRQRNRLLFNIKHNHSNRDPLFIYNLQLSELIEYIYQKRQEFIDFINQNLSDYYSRISNTSTSLRIEYSPTLSYEKNAIISQLEASIMDDIRLGYTLKGPHKDDFIITLNSTDTRVGFSRGENRSLILALKMVELEFINKKISKLPILLLDDVLSELDESRQHHLLNYSRARQTFITSTSVYSDIKDYQVIKI